MKKANEQKKKENLFELMTTLLFFGVYVLLSFIGVFIFMGILVGMELSDEPVSVIFIGMLLFSWLSNCVYQLTLNDLERKKEKLEAKA
jgi:uncharacterized membrane protein (DUF485 family)